MLVESAPGPRSAHLPHPRIATAVAAQPGVISPATLRIYSQGFSLHPERLKRTLPADSMLNCAPPRFELLGLRNRRSSSPNTESRAGCPFAQEEKTACGLTLRSRVS